MRVRVRVRFGVRVRVRVKLGIGLGLGLGWDLVCVRVEVKRERLTCAWLCGSHTFTHTGERLGLSYPNADPDADAPSRQS